MALLGAAVMGKVTQKELDGFEYELAICVSTIDQMKRWQ